MAGTTVLRMLGLGREAMNKTCDSHNKNQDISLIPKLRTMNALDRRELDTEDH